MRWDMDATTQPQTAGIQRPAFKEKYDHFIGGTWVAPSNGEYFDNISPIDGKPFTKAARGTKEDKSYRGSSHRFSRVVEYFGTGPQ